MVPRHEPVKWDCIIAIRRIHTGSFAGLYEVVELDGAGRVKRVITDANSKSMAASLTAGVIARV